MAYGKGPIKTGKLIPGKPGKRKPVKPVRPEPKVLMNEGRMYAGGDPNFNERTGEYRNTTKEKNLGSKDSKEYRYNEYKKAKVKKRIIVGPPAKRKPVQPKVGR